MCVVDYSEPVRLKGYVVWYKEWGWRAARLCRRRWKYYRERLNTCHMGLVTCDVRVHNLTQLLPSPRWCRPCFYCQDFQDRQCQHSQGIDQGEESSPPLSHRRIRSRPLPGSKAKENCTLWIRSLRFSARLWRMNTSKFWYKNPLVRSFNALLTCSENFKFPRHLHARMFLFSTEFLQK